MKNRRLLTILIIFIVIGTFAVLGSALFAVRNVTVQFTNEPIFQKDEEAQVESSLRSSVLGFTQKKNAIFGINREKIKSTIEEANTRVRVTNIEVKFPNRIEIKIRERYPVYKLQFGDGTTAVMCGQLRVLEKLDAAALNDLEVNKVKWPLIVIPDEIGTGLELDDFQVGDYLTELENKDPYLNVLRELAPFFARLSTFEDAICNIFESISFDGGLPDIPAAPGNIRLVMKARAATPNVTYHKNHFDFIVWNADSVICKLTKKLTKGWSALQENHTYPGVYQIWEQATYVKEDAHGQKLELKVPDGILVTYREFYIGEGRQP